jgi:hypothetical protein
MRRAERGLKANAFKAAFFSLTSRRVHTGQVWPM